MTAGQADLFGRDYALKLTLEERARFRRRIEPPAPGKQWGGAQRLASQLQVRERRGELEANERELERAFVYGYAYGDGTWEKAYFRPVVDAAKRQGWTPPPQLLEDVRRRRLEVKGRAKERQR